MTAAQVTDLKSRLAHIQLSLFEQLGGAFDPDSPQVVGEREMLMGRKEPAQVVPPASQMGGEFRKAQRLVEVAVQEGLHGLDPREGLSG
jgi:hypothetical protein